MNMFSCYSSSGCERNWNTFEGVHKKNQNRLEASKLNNLVYVQFNANLMKKKQKRKDRNMEIVDVDEVDPEMVNEDLGTIDYQAPRESPRTSELYDEDFKSWSEEKMLEEDEYESDEVQIMEVCGEDYEIICFIFVLFKLIMNFVDDDLYIVLNITFP
uniref:HAT C-terminal dimerisation domain-containing protein n=1 Tax=Lactuca sativa TaxID=4236 RepID=A0A9R1WFB7_LACSA|nr:hypothetical protein LSAT_V11C200051850 [Lactuca sativa]